MTLKKNTVHLDNYWKEMTNESVMACAFTCPKDALKISVLNSWRVNGNYTFEGAPATDDEVCGYCKKAYLRYFHEAETLKNHDNN